MLEFVWPNLTPNDGTKHRNSENILCEKNNYEMNRRANSNKIKIIAFMTQFSIRIFSSMCFHIVHNWFCRKSTVFQQMDKNVSQNNKSIPMTSRGGRQWWCDIVKYLKHTKNQSPQTPRCIAKRRGMMWLIFDSVNRNATIWRITWLSLIFLLLSLFTSILYTR